MTEARHPAAGSSGSGSVLIAYRGSARGLADRLGAAGALGARDVIVDFGETETLSSVALEALLRSGRELGARGGRLAVVSLRPSLRRLLRLTLLQCAFAVHTSVDAAFRSTA